MEESVWIEDRGSESPDNFNLGGSSGSETVLVPVSFVQYNSLREVFLGESEDVFQISCAFFRKTLQEWRERILRDQERSAKNELVLRTMRRETWEKKDQEREASRNQRDILRVWEEAHEENSLVTEALEAEGLLFWAYPSAATARDRQECGKDVSHKGIVHVKVPGKFDFSVELVVKWGKDRGIVVMHRPCEGEPGEYKVFSKEYLPSGEAEVCFILPASRSEILRLASEGLFSC